MPGRLMLLLRGSSPSPQCRQLLDRLVPDNPRGQHDVARPAARPAEADEYAIPAGPVLGDKTLPAFGQRQRRRAPRAVPGRVAPVPLRVDREPPTLEVAANSDASPGTSASRASPGTSSNPSRHPAAAFRFSCALMCSFFSASACGLNRDEARSMKSMANVAPESNLFFSHGRSIRER